MMTGYRCENPESDCFVISYKHKSRPLHYHRCFEMVYVTEGSATHLIKHPDGHEETHVLSVGDYLILDYNTLHSYIDGTKDFRVTNFLFRPSLIGRISTPEPSFSAILSIPPFNFGKDSLTAIPSNMRLHDENGLIGETFKKALLVYQTKKYAYRELLRNYAIEIILFSVDPFIKNLSNSKESKIILQIQEYIATYYTEPITLTQICNDMFYNLQYISKKFKEVCGVSFEHYLQEVRIRNARSLLIETNHRIDDIATMVGYKDTSSFRKVFGKITGLSPFDFRKQYKANINSQ